MIAHVIRWSARNVFLVGLATVFVIFAGIYGVSRVPLDAIPDLSDVQVIVYTEYPGQAPQVVEDQVTYPLSTALLSVPKSRVVRGFSFFGVSFVYVIFEDGTDLYWARSRVLEYLSSAARRLPAGVAPSLGPDATVSVGCTNTSSAAHNAAWPNCAPLRIGTSAMASRKRKVLLRSRA
jgi:copper/silver efflux system protein